MGNSYTKQMVFTAVFVLFALLASINGTHADNRYVSRDIADSTVKPGGQVDVTLYVVTEAEDRFFLIDEIIPDGWSVVDTGTLFEAGKVNASEARHLKKAVIQGISETSFTYTLQAPSNTGKYYFSGNYYIEGMSGFRDMVGQFSIEVSTSTNDPDNGKNNGKTGNTGNGREGYDITGNIPSASQCPEGIITHECVCQGSKQIIGYCCSDEYQTIACAINQGPVPFLAGCNSSKAYVCGSNIGRCSYGTRLCTNGTLSDCLGGIGPVLELCNGIDDDCDGFVDNDCSSPESTTCIDGAIPETGCFCGGVFCSEGYCYNGNFSEESSGYPWMLLAILGTMMLMLLIAGIIYRTHRRAKKVTLKSFRDNMNMQIMPKYTDPPTPDNIFNEDIDDT